MLPEPLGDSTDRILSLAAEPSGKMEVRIELGAMGSPIGNGGSGGRRRGTRVEGEVDAVKLARVTSCSTMKFDASTRMSTFAPAWVI